MNYTSFSIDKLTERDKHLISQLENDETVVINRRMHNADYAVMQWAIKHNKYVYCGGAVNRNGVHVLASKWENPFRKGSHEERCRLYERYLLNTPKLMNSLHELKGKALACWCVPGELCHCEVLLKHVKALDLHPVQLELSL